MTSRAISILALPSICPHMLPEASSTKIVRVGCSAACRGDDSTAIHSARSFQQCHIFFLSMLPRFLIRWGDCCFDMISVCGSAASSAQLLQQGSVQADPGFEIRDRETLVGRVDLTIG